MQILCQAGIRAARTLLELRHRHRDESKESIEEYRMEYTGWNSLVPALELLAVILVIGAAIVLVRRLRQRG
jgi:flagellar biogenesis protein FliO